MKQIRTLMGKSRIGQIRISTDTKSSRTTGSCSLNSKQRIGSVEKLELLSIYWGVTRKKLLFIICFQIIQRCPIYTVQKKMKCGNILYFSMLLAFLNQTEANKNYNFMDDEEMLHLSETFKQIDRLEHLNVVQVSEFFFKIWFTTIISNKPQHRHVAAFAIGSNDYVNESIPCVRDMIDIYTTIQRISRHYPYLKKFEMDRFENITQINMAEVQVSTKEDENLHAMEKIKLKLFGKDDLMGQLARGNQVIKKFPLK